MNWDAIGATGEWAGAIAVVATLGYLAVQIRQNASSMRSSAELEAMVGLLILFTSCSSLTPEGRLVRLVEQDFL